MKYQGNKRSTTISDGTNLVHKLDTVTPITVCILNFGFRSFFEGPITR